MIAVEDLHVSLGSNQVLEGVDLSVPAGTLVGLVGPNGAGKTTLIETAAGTIVPDAGRVRIDGDDVHELSSRAASRRVAVVPQDTSPSFPFDVRDVVAMGRTPHRTRFERVDETDRRAVHEALERTDTAALADRGIDEVSGGERQRVLLARAVAQDAPALLLDEPTASLDVHHQVRTFELVEELAGEGRAALAAVHDLGLAARYCDRLALLAEGELLAVGPPTEVLTADRIETAFGGDVVVAVHPDTNVPLVTVYPD